MAHRSLPSVEPDCAELVNGLIGVLEKLYPAAEAIPRVALLGAKQTAEPS